MVNTRILFLDSEIPEDITQKKNPFITTKYDSSRDEKSHTHLQLDSLAIQLYVLDFKIDTNRRDECRGKRIVRVSQQQTGFSDT
jgi:hypothetical protein